ncbi:MAG: 50S ribosomal protein L3 [Parcubacteria group bacterium CG08_land_8_20_14_0_20_48_21]|nr:MAG: 50S ribosomal protein L3 [Parcubacteria group bacterium CG2_30_48_51]PIS32624.1 MAG: 50S ribosomal protein L3 [Parcubacteria group bacterium CG08_land_8_20_14_0_20_48_21]PIW79287.1 MAG: 50S ribosomal protein L3 [Parcubacteria group bacterium CG_4_8_14_3_um_filter_48_16]PIY77588.1 MAG: 50S ribosomal protein L3 [Parcubacteria group bacterium CG_4_10_14_0_8_um_filter_48_154]PIZ77173.1 MAG: 50S ribosomal protein L3 [bacterium CG_4_10_14_0_2_um_filter_48_144]PJC40127.1 MAG: 50S ribosomal pr
MKMLIGTKLRMTQIYSQEGKVVPVTIVKADPCTIVQVKTEPTDGYNAVQLGYGAKKYATKPMAGHTKGKGPYRLLREFRVEDVGTLSSLKIGDALTIAQFTEGDMLVVAGISKGKGFQGVVRRHGFAGQRATHGNKDQLRMPGSIGSTDPQRVFKGMRMAGHMGADRVTVHNLKVAKVDTQLNELYIAGAIPGSRNSIILVTANAA